MYTWCISIIIAYEDNDDADDHHHDNDNDHGHHPHVMIMIMIIRHLHICYAAYKSHSITDAQKKEPYIYTEVFMYTR